MSNRAAQYLDLWLKLQTRELRFFIEASEKAFAAAFDMFANDVAEKMKAMAQEEQERYHDFTADKAFALAERFPRLGRHLAFAATFAHFEHTLLSVCDRIQKSSNIPLSVRDLKHSGVEAAKVYLKKVAKIPLPTNDQNWHKNRRLWRDSEFNHALRVARAGISL